MTHGNRKEPSLSWFELNGLSLRPILGDGQITVVTAFLSFTHNEHDYVHNAGRDGIIRHSHIETNVNNFA